MPGFDSSHQQKVLPLNASYIMLQLTTGIFSNANMKPAARTCYSSLGEKKVYTWWVQHRKVSVGILIKYQQLKFIVKNY